MNLKKELLKVILTFSVLFLTSPTINSQQKTENLDSLLTYCNTNGIFNGTVLIAENQNVIYKKTLGYADFEKGEKLTPDHQFYLASVSKQFTTMAVMMLKEKGQLSYDDKLSKYFDEFPDYADDVTILNLMTHTSGIPNHYRLVEQKPGLSNQDAFNKLITVQELDFEPGTQYRYSNGGFILLAMIVEKVSGQSLHDFLEQNVFGPLDMNNTFVYDKTYKINKKAIGYDIFGNNDDYIFYTTGAGGIYSTVEDLFKWDQALYTDKLVSHESLEEAFSPFRLTDNSFSDYGFGWAVNYDDNIVSHGGGLAGFRTYIERQMDNKNTIIFLTNNGDAVQFGALKNALSNILNDQPFELPKIPVQLTMNEYYTKYGVDSATAWYREQIENKNKRFNFAEVQLNEYGYYLLAKKDIDGAIKVFTLNTETFPKEYNTYDSLGEAFFTKGNTELALKSYRKSLELNPDNKNAKEMINKIENNNTLRN